MFVFCHYNSFNNQDARNDIDNPNIQNLNPPVAK